MYWGNMFNNLVLHDRSGKSVVKAVLTFVVASIVIGCLTGTGFQIGSPFAGEGAGAAMGANSAAGAVGQMNVLSFGTTNFLPVPYWGGGGGGGGGGPSIGQTSTGIPTVPYDPYTGEVLENYTNPATGETLTKGTIIPKSMLPVLKVYQRAILSDPQLPELNTQTTPDGFYNQKPPAGATGSALPPTPTPPATGTSTNGQTTPGTMTDTPSSTTQ